MEKICGAKNARGKPCQNPPLKDSQTCRYHGGKQSQRKGRIAKQEAKSTKALQALGEVPEKDVSPTEALLQLVTQKWAEVQWLRSKVQQLVESKGDEALVWGVVQHEEGTGPEGPIDKETKKAALNIWYETLHKAENQLKEYSAAALKAGVEQRQIELQEAQAVLFAQALNRIFDALELTHEQSKRIPKVVPQILRTLPTA